MNKLSKELTPPSLSHLFGPPAGYRGVFGWLCGYSADAAFLDGAAERFSGQTHSQRAHIGKILLAAMLDPGTPQIVPTDAPGVLHLGYGDYKNRPFRLLHAKVAILGFAPDGIDVEGAGWKVRAIVGTGNWTRQTVEDSLDLAWSVDVGAAQLAMPDDATATACADIRAVWNLCKWLRPQFDLRALNSLPADQITSETIVATGQLEGCLADISAQAGGTASRFFDNRGTSMLEQLPKMILRTARGVSRNYIALGSGFFESAANSGTPVVPRVLDRIVTQLQEREDGSSLLTKTPEVDIYVNPEACQCVAESVSAMTQRGWNIRKAGVPAFMGNKERSLHAKFIFSARYQRRSDHFSSAWLYLGSGNLTHAGFLRAARRAVGNLEAGVVTAVPPMSWADLAARLPVQWDTCINEDTEPIEAGEPEPDRPIAFLAAPIAHLRYVQNGDTPHLIAEAQASDAFEVMGPAGELLVRTDAGFAWTGDAPRMATVCWSFGGQNLRAAIPVLDEFGRFCAVALSPIDLEDVWWQLANFPQAPDNGELSPECGEDSFVRDGGTAVIAQQDDSYAIRSAMKVVEQIAHRQIGIARVDWFAWCVRLEQTLTLASASSAVVECRALGLNTLSPLRHAAFRPDFAANADTDEGRIYEAVLGRVEAKWRMQDCKRIG